MPKQNPIKNVHVHQMSTKHPWRSAYFWKAESTPQWVSRAWRLGGFKNWLPEFPPIFQLLVIWWFGILRVISNTPFHQGILGIQTTNPNHQLIISWIFDECEKMGSLLLMVQKSGCHQLRLVGYLPLFTTGFSTISGGCLGFLNHHQYVFMWFMPVFTMGFYIWFHCISTSAFLDFLSIKHQKRRYWWREQEWFSLRNEEADVLLGTQTSNWFI